MGTPCLKTTFVNEQQLPLVYEPGSPAARVESALTAWLRANSAEVAESLRTHGAVLFRGFELADAAAFERVALALDPELVSSYSGVAVRTPITKYVHTSTELPPHYPIPQHAELAYTRNPPRKIFFFCDEAPKVGGETPLCDLRKVWAELPDPLRSRFDAASIRYFRVHGAPDERRFRLWGSRRWSDVFQTVDRHEVERRASAMGLMTTWLRDGALRLENILPATRVHPLHGTRAWHNQANLFHPDGPLIEYEHIVRQRRSLRSLLVRAALRCLSRIRRWLLPRTGFDWNVELGDGSAIPTRDIEQIYSVLWRNLACFTWRPGDLVVVDNYSVSHGRLPFHGKRRIMVALTDGYGG
jgi:alpha-ketoglutarate-dependent taurine dioxygenase